MAVSWLILFCVTGKAAASSATRDYKGIIPSQHIWIVTGMSDMTRQAGYSIDESLYGKYSKNH